MHFFILGLKIVKNSLKKAKVSLNICGPHAGRKLSAPQQKQPKSLRAAPHAANPRSRNLGFLKILAHK
jgi:hypothetical protein